MIKDGQLSAILDPGQVRGLIEQAGLDISANSPLVGRIDHFPAGDAAALRTNGLLNDRWLEAISVLARPEHRVRVVTIGAGLVKVAVFHAGPSSKDNDLVACWPEGDDFHISFPWRADDLTANAMTVLTADRLEKVVDFSVSLTPEGFMALAAAVDDLGERQEDSRLKTRHGAPHLTIEDLRREVDIGLAGNDPRRLVNLMGFIAPQGAEPKPEALVRGLTELVRVGLVKLAETGWEPEEPLTWLTACWQHPLPAVLHEVILKKGLAVLDLKYQVALRAGGPLWIIEYLGLMEGRPEIRFQTVDGASYGRELSRIIKPPALAPLGPRCPNPACGRPVPAGQRFCGACGASVEPPAKEKPKERFCPACGHQVKADKKFCTNCGKQLM